MIDDDMVVANMVALMDEDIVGVAIVVFITITVGDIIAMS